MTESIKIEIERFFRTVMRENGHVGWLLRWCESDAYCWRDRRIIDICPVDSLDTCKQLLLHEVAHIDVVESHGSQHTVRFWKHLEQLVQKHLNSGLDARQKEMASVCCPSFVSKRGKKIALKNSGNYECQTAKLRRHNAERRTWNHRMDSWQS